MKLLCSRAICITLSDSWISLVGTRSPVGNHVVGFICGNKKSGTSLASPQTNNIDRRGWAKWATHWRSFLHNFGALHCSEWHYSVVIWFSLFYSVGLHNVICGSVGWCLLWGRSISRRSFPLLDGWVSEWVGKRACVCGCVFACVHLWMLVLDREIKFVLEMGDGLILKFAGMKLAVWM